MLGNIISWLLGLACALVLGAAFYGAMAYQLTGEEGKAAAHAGTEATPAPLAPGMSSAALYPGALLTLDEAQLISEHAEDLAFGGRICRVIARRYKEASGMEVLAISAYPAAYLERMAREDYVPQLVTGFSLAGIDAVYALKGENALLAAREGEYVYMIEAKADEQTMYVLGTSAYLQ